jgi:hypothetical protein
MMRRHLPNRRALMRNGNGDPSGPLGCALDILSNQGN